MEEFKLEQQKVNETLNVIKEIVSKEQDDLNKLYDDNTMNINEVWQTAKRKKVHLNNLKSSLDKPYFARIDFKAKDDQKKQTIYIGKNGIMKDTKVVVTDWRAPISSLYYDAEIGDCSYEAPIGEIKGELDLKRQYEIENGQLQKYFDVDLVSNDDLLQKYLNSNNDTRLKSIVATIQKEQNEVIRKQMYDNLIIQGVAGSGKTTVALHRIAYLVYNYINTVNQNQYLIIGPNKVFMQYIKSVLPELDVSGVQQCIFEQFAKTYLDADISINSSIDKVNANICGKQGINFDKFKCSMEYKNMIDCFLEQYYNSITSKDIKIADFIVIPNQKIKEIFNFINNNYSVSLNDKIELLINQLCSFVENNKNEIITRFNDYAYTKFNQATNEEKDELRSKFYKQRMEIEKNCRTIIRKSYDKAKNDPIKLYRLFIETIDSFNDCELLKKQTLKNIKKGNYDFEDLPALMYIKASICPDKSFDSIKHVVIDEAQDLGEFNFLVLKKCLPNATFSIFGDLAQSIYDYRGINNWQDVNKIMFDNNGEIINFNKSYRTTSEIIGTADNVASSIGLSRSEYVIRHGKPVEYTKTKDNVKQIIDKISEYKKKGYKTIAIISKTDSQSKKINSELALNGLNIPDVTYDDNLNDEKFNICTISNQLAKGLEFDAVIINNVSENNYSSNSKLDMKLLYVAITRALHELDIIYSGQLPQPLINEPEKVKKLKTNI